MAGIGIEEIAEEVWSAIEAFPDVEGGVDDLDVGGFTNGAKKANTTW